MAPEHLTDSEYRKQSDRVNKIANEMGKLFNRGGHLAKQSPEYQAAEDRYNKAKEKLGE